MFKIFFCDLEDLKGKRWDTNYWRSDYLVLIEQLSRFRIPVKTIGEIAYTAIGQSGRRSFTENEEVQYLIVGNILNSGINYNRRKRFVSNGSFNDPNRSRLEELDLLVVISGGGSIGRVTITSDIETPTNISQDIALVRLKENQYSTLMFLQSKWGNAQILRLESGTGVTHLNQNDVRSIKIPQFDSDLEEWCERKWGSIHLLHNTYINNKDSKLLNEIEKRRQTLIQQFERKVSLYIKNQ